MLIHASAAELYFSVVHMWMTRKFDFLAVSELSLKDHYPVDMILSSNMNLSVLIHFLTSIYVTFASKLI